MKRLALLIGSAALALGAGITLVPSASAAPADPNPWVWAYPQANFGGTPTGMWTGDQNGIVTKSSWQSVKNVSQSLACGGNVKGSTQTSFNVSYNFWAGGQWASIGAPFSSKQPLNAFEWGHC